MRRLKLNGQMWLYERGNQRIVVENAWAIHTGRGIELLTQERVTVNGEFIRDCTPPATTLLRWTDWYEDTIILGDSLVPFILQVKSGIMKVKARLLIDDQEAPWTEIQSASWTGPLGQWPEWDRLSAAHSPGV